MTCIKQTVKATIITLKGAEFVGTNACNNPQEVCPRDLRGFSSGEGYYLCKLICEQVSHAEVAAIENAGEACKGAVLVLEGHTYACGDCMREAADAGIEDIIIK